MKETLSGLFRRPRGRREKGAYFETLARDFLAAQGLTDFQSNYLGRCGEIDLIARDGEYLVFVEVRYRQASAHGSPVATVTRHKQEKIRRTALLFLQKHGLTNRMPCRFDVVGIIEGTGGPEFRWIKNAF